MSDVIFKGVFHYVCKLNEGRYAVRVEKTTGEVLNCHIAISIKDYDARREAMDKAGSLDTIALSEVDHGLMKCG